MATGKMNLNTEVVSWESPITFMQYYNPEQFEIVGATESEGVGFSEGLWDATSGVAQPLVNGGKKYKRIFIRRKGEVCGA